MDAGVGGRLRHETGGEGSTKNSAINGAVELNTIVADNGAVLCKSSNKFS
jgi:hypothetical protein